MGKPAAEDNFLSAGNTGVKVNSRCVCVCFGFCIFFPALLLLLVSVEDNLSMSV